MLRKKRKIYKLGDVQFELMRIVWNKGKATVREVTETIARKRKMAYPTVLTMLRELEKKGLLVHDVDGRTYVYRPTRSRYSITTSILKDIKRRVFDNSLEALFTRLFEVEKMDPDELKHIKTLIARKEKGQKIRE